MAAIQQMELLRIRGSLGAGWGANQTWYPDRWRRTSGCGPTTCSHLLWYLAKTRQHLQGLWPHKGNSRADILALMEEVWHYVTPTAMGVNDIAILAEGAKRYGRDKGISLAAHTLPVSPVAAKRPPAEAMRDFLAGALGRDLPVAFLNLSNGRLHNLESWHWVTLVALDESRLAAEMLDQGAKSEIDLGLWLETTRLGGGFVALEE